MSSGFNLAEKAKPTRVSFAAGGDADMEDEGLNPPLVRERWIDQSNVFLDADYRNQTNSDANTSQWIIGSDTNNQNGFNKSSFFANRVKKFTPNYLQVAIYAPNINPRNNTFIFAIGGFQWQATIAINNYTRLTTDYNNVPLTTPATYDVNAPTWAPLSAEFNGDPDDGLIDHILTAMNTARRVDNPAIIYDPGLAGYGQFLAEFSNGYDLYVNIITPIQRYWNKHLNENLIKGNRTYGYIYCKIVGGDERVDWRMIGGNAIDKGKHVWGPSPVDPNDTRTYKSYLFGPAQFQYTRYFDVIMPELCQFSKLTNSGTGVPSGLIARVYFNDIQPIGLYEITLDNYRQQQINMRKDYVLNYLTIEIRDEYGDLYEIPKLIRGVLDAEVNQVNWPNAQGISLNLVSQL